MNAPLIPLYLAEPAAAGLHLHGTLDYDAKDNCYSLEGEPAVMELAKRVFPGCTGRRSEGNIVRFKATRRAAGDLNWLLLRFPVEIRCPDRLAADRELAIAHALRRESNTVAPPVTDPPGFIGKLLGYQAEGVAYLLANKRCLLADDMGLGKTIEALGALAAGGLFPALVVPTANTQPQWVRLAQKFLSIQAAGELITRPPVCRVLKGLTPGDLGQASIYIAHYGILRGWHEKLVGYGFKAIVFDEIQELRKTGSQKYSCASLISQEVEHVWGLSGTPIYNYGGEIWAVLNILDYHCLGDFESFTREWCTGYRSEVVAKPAILGDHLRREGLMLRRQKSQVQSQLPPKRRVVTVVGHEQDEYGKLIRNAVKMARGFASIEDWTERGRVVRQIENEARRATGVAKAPMVADFVKALLEAGERVLLCSHHHDVHDILGERLVEFKPVKITGRETPTQKEEALRDFAEGKTGLVQLSLRTTAGLDGLQGRGTCVVFAELDWSPAVHAQCEDRLHRIGVAADSILCYYLVTDTGSDEVMQEALGLKIGQFVGVMRDAVESDEDRAMAGREAMKHLEGIVARLSRGGGS